MPNKSAEAANTANYTIQASATVAAALTLEQWVALAGLALMIASFVINVVLQIRRDKRESEEARLKAEHLKRRSGDN